ncbi:VOC family protein [Nakamurella multipartita]|uniref:Glyoxalase/bleomycin resistance protein/dioxygenase n=1 Tax=Nakamurella multipartita (strain ATCC 700099 / DSM 44233 / CIP 104796 / JCM 9543 / NBRC 105858 / Y-104) TaxID=479431 RepID=C8XEJ9_NAKMY|nr:VOC family protein [Nakamurella multipartita]ACV77857.1 Glyoxalase/bleomycin resistance protein/dioxygenase [Nakamurella multipartita DSM 44233]HOZ57074.1 VOC family protein [Nakamurella multipartita]
MPTNLRLEIFPADLNATVRFYVDLLGFSLVEDRRADPLPYLSLVRDGVRLGAVTVPGGSPAHRHPPTGAEIVLEVDYLHAERDRIARAGWPIEEDITLRPWGLKDFRVLDPDGYYLRFTTHGR